MNKLNVINHRIFEEISIIQDIEQSKLKTANQKFLHAFLDPYNNVFLNVYRLEELTDVLFEILIKTNMISFDDINDLINCTFDLDESCCDEFEELYSLGQHIIDKNN